MMTYRELLEAIGRAKELKAECDTACENPKRWKGTAEEQDDADALVRAADRALDGEIGT
jgi:hypothetical protein